LDYDGEYEEDHDDIVLYADNFEVRWDIF
jgi:hypothetical protein